MERNVILGTTVVVAIALATTMVLRQQHQDEGAVSDDPSAIVASTPDFPSSGTEEPQNEQPSSPLEDRRDDALLSQVEHKYRFLFNDVDRAHVDELKRRLLERESNPDPRQRDNIDSSISQLLPAQEFEYFRALRDSDLEQHHLDEYTGGISNVAPLSAIQERQLLDAKLRQKERYESVLREAGLSRDTLSQAEREYAHTQATEALQRYLNEYLQEVSPTLTDEQYSLLKNYETTEFERQLARLQQQINAN